MAPPVSSSSPSPSPSPSAAVGRKLPTDRSAAPSDASMHVVVVGGGISGLSCATELVERGVRVTLLERDERFGGQSRSIERDGVHLCYSWRIFTTSYDNLWDVLSRVRTADGRTVRDNFVAVGPYRTGTDDERHLSVLGVRLFEAPATLAADERAELVGRIVTLLSLSDARLRAYDDTTIFDYLRPRSADAVAYVDHIVGPFLGLEARRASVLCAATMLQAVYARAKGLLPNAPYEQAIFAPWAEHLQRAGVRMRTGVSVDHVEANRVHLDDGTTIEADRVVLCVDQHALATLARRSPCLGLRDTAEFAERATQLYFSFELLVPGEVDFEWEVFTVKEAPWLPIVERWNRFFGARADEGGGGGGGAYLPLGYAEQWNVAVLDGLPYEGEPIARTPPARIVAHTLRQLRESRMLGDVRLRDGTPLWSAPLRVRVWPYWTMVDGRLVNTQAQYKVSFNAGCFALAPPMRTCEPSVLIGSVIARHHPIVSQEAACHNGRAAARAILGPGALRLHPPRRLLPPLPVNLLDRALHACALPEVRYDERTFVATNVLLTTVVVALVYVAVRIAWQRVFDRSPPRASRQPVHERELQAVRAPELILADGHRPTTGRLLCDP